VIGPPRSGTTLLSYLLAGGQGVLSLSEPFLAHAVQPDWKLQRFFCHYQRAAGLRRRRPPYQGNAERFGRFLRQMAVENGFRELVIKETYRRGGLRTAWHNETLLDRLVRGGEPAIALIRQPYDLAASSLHLFHWVTGPRGWLIRVRVRRAPAFWNTTQVVRWAAENWNAFLAWARRHDLRIVRYEDLVQEPRTQLEIICQHCGLRFQESMLDKSRARAAFGGMGDVGVLKRPRPIDRKSVGHGRHLTDEQRRIVRDTCQHGARDFDYPL